MFLKLGTEKRTNTKTHQKLLEETEVCKHAYNNKNWNILPYTEKKDERVPANKHHRTIFKW